MRSLLGPVILKGKKRKEKCFFLFLYLVAAMFSHDCKRNAIVDWNPTYRIKEKDGIAEKSLPPLIDGNEDK